MSLESLPAINAVHAHERVSSKYGFMNTKQILDHVKAQGFEVVSARQSGSVKKANLPFKKHMIRLRHVDSKPLLGEVHPEIVLVNSHEGTSSLKIMFGLYRMVCANGLVVSAGINDSMIRLRHHLVNVEKLDESIKTITAQADKVMKVVEKMQNTPLTDIQALQFAMEAMDMKYKERGKTSPIDAIQLLDYRREEDKQNNLWLVFNRIQENLVRGGLRGVSATGRPLVTTQIRHIDRNIEANQGLWKIAESYLPA